MDCEIVAEKGNKKYKSLLGVFLKTSKKRLLISVLVSFFLFLLLTTFLLTWFNYRYKSFENYYTDYNWYNDNRVSISTRDLSLKNDTDTYLALAIDELHATLDDLAAGMFDNHTASMQYKMESINYNLTQIYDASLLTLQQEAFDILTTRFVEGRLPYTESELIYYPSDLLSPNYQIGDQLGLQVTIDETSYTHNFTIVGIIDSVSHTLYQNGYSNDIFESVRVSGEEFDYFKMDLFFTNPQLFVDIVANYPYNQTGSLTFKMDFNYQFDVKDSYNLLTIANELNIIQAYSDFEYFSDFSTLCSDLESFIFSFELNWLSQTLTIFILGVPIFLLFGLLIIELFNTGNFEKTTQFKLFKTYGLEFATLRKILFTENLITASVGFFSGIPLGILIGFGISFYGLDVATINLYLIAFLEPTIPLILLALFLFLLIGGFVTETFLAKRTVQLTSEIFKSKRKKFIRRLFTSMESLFLISGVFTFVIGLLSWLYISSSYYAISTFIVLLNICLVLMFVGILLTLAALFLILTRLLVFLWRYVGKKIWQRRKSYFTLALKQLSIYSNDYKRIIFTMLLISLCVSPGLVITKSSNNHLEMEANLKVGFSDVIIQTWADNNTMLMENISTITGVDLLTEVEVVTIRKLGNVRATSSEKAFYVDILNIYNVTDFIDVISANFPDSCKYTLADIAKLETNMTYMMSSEYAQRKNYDKNALYTSSEITSSYEDSYNMTFINKFDCFPLLPYKSSNFLERVVEDRYNLVMSNLTFSQLRHKFGYSTSFLNDTYILVRTTPIANKTLIVSDIKNLPYNIHVTTFEDELYAMKLILNKFTLTFLIVVTIISFILVIFYGFLTARNIYKQKMRIVETEYTVGAKKHQILLNFSIELLLVLIIPLVISIITSSTLLYTVYDYSFSIPQTYKKFVPWLPIWFIIFILLFCLVSISIGWLLELWNQFHRYRPARQE
ncbi:MAG: FtsX-like permease family protein [Asgard group archaeon]|nr:FtsX-like permease family protein [Asgard group archaeon]